MTRRTRGRSKASASPTKRFTRSIDRSKIPGGPRRGGRQPSVASRGEFAAFLSRLRRLEVVVMMIAGKMPASGLDGLLDSVLQLHSDTKDIVDGSESGDKEV